MGQLTLPVGLRDGNTLASYLPAANPEALAAVTSLLAGRELFVYLWGAPGTGKSHLLEAVAEAVASEGLKVAYIALGLQPLPDIDVLEGVADTADIVCIDDADRIAGDPRWEEAFFHLFNGLRARGARLAVVAAAPPMALGLSLADLASRFGSGLTVQMAPLDDQTRLAILVFRAARRGLDLPPETGRFLLTRTSRRLDALVALLGQLDRAALVHQRRLTVPFVRQVLGWGA